MRRPPAVARDDNDQERSVSRKLQPKARAEVYRVIKRVGDSNYILGDVATGKEVSAFKQPVHADRIVPMEGGVLDEPIAESKEVVIEQRHGTITEQAWDGRVPVRLATDEAEDAFAHQFANDGAKRDEGKPGVWVDLARHTYYFPEVLSHIGEGRKRRERRTSETEPTSGASGEAVGFRSTGRA